MLTKVSVSTSLLLLIYLLWPGPNSIRDFPELPDSYKSTLSGDTVEVPNVVGYFSDNYRTLSVDFYSRLFQQKTRLFFPPLRLNYPPEFAFTAIKDQTLSTYLEELVYPLRDSLYINGLEPFYEGGEAKYWGAYGFYEGGNVYQTKVTLRYYPSAIWARLVLWVGINICVFLLWKLSKKILLS